MAQAGHAAGAINSGSNIGQMLQCARQRPSAVKGLYDKTVLNVSNLAVKRPLAGQIGFVFFGLAKLLHYFFL